MKLNYVTEFNFKDSTGIEHFYLIVKVKELDKTIPFAVNPRLPDISKPTYVEIKKSLLKNDGKFLQKNLGITLLARSVKLDEKSRIANINFGINVSNEADEKGQSLFGIANGGHTHRVILSALSEYGPQDLDNQYINIRIVTGVEGINQVVELAKALNTTVNVEPLSLANLSGDFDWLKKAAGSLEKDIRWFQNDDGIIDVDYLINLMLCMHPGKFSVDEDAEDKAHPYKAYSSKAAARKEYQQDATDSNNLKKLSLLVPDILELRDYIQLRAHEVASRAAIKSNTKIFIKPKIKKEDQFISHKHRAETFPEMGLSKPALFLILASYRCLVKQTNNKHEWDVKGGVDGVKEFYVDQLLSGQIERIKSIVADRYPGASPTKWGKDPYIWARVYRLTEERFRNKS